MKNFLKIALLSAGIMISGVGAANADTFFSMVNTNGSDGIVADVNTVCKNFVRNGDIDNFKNNMLDISNALSTAEFKTMQKNISDSAYQNRQNAFNDMKQIAIHLRSIADKCNGYGGVIGQK